MCLSLLYTDPLHCLEKSLVGNKEDLENKASLHHSICSVTNARFEHIYELWNGLTSRLPNSSNSEAAPQGWMSWEQQTLAAHAVPSLTGCNMVEPKKGKTGHGNRSTVLNKVAWRAWAGVHPGSLLRKRRSQDWARDTCNSAQTGLGCPSLTGLSPNRSSGPTGRKCLGGGPGEARQGS